MQYRLSAFGDDVQDQERACAKWSPVDAVWACRAETGWTRRPEPAHSRADTDLDIVLTMTATLCVPSSPTNRGEESDAGTCCCKEILGRAGTAIVKAGSVTLASNAATSPCTAIRAVGGDARHDADGHFGDA